MNEYTTPFVPSSSASFEDYQRWCATEAACMHCGRTWASRPLNPRYQPGGRDPDTWAKYTDLWITETDCGCKR